MKWIEVQDWGGLNPDQVRKGLQWINNFFAAPNYRFKSWRISCSPKYSFVVSYIYHEVILLVGNIWSMFFNYLHAIVHFFWDPCMLQGSDTTYMYSSTYKTTLQHVRALLHSCSHLVRVQSHYQFIACVVVSWRTCLFASMAWCILKIKNQLFKNWVLLTFASVKGTQAQTWI